MDSITFHRTFSVFQYSPCKHFIHVSSVKRHDLQNNLALLAATVIIRYSLVIR